MSGWKTDQSGKPARVAPPFYGKELGVDFDPNDFDRSIQEQGDRIAWEQAARCPCAANDDTGQPDPTCDTCGGAGWEYHSPLEIRAIVDRLEYHLDLLGGSIGDWVFGAAMFTMQPIHQPNFRDRFRLIDSVVSHSEVITRGLEQRPDRLAFPVSGRSEAVLVGEGDEQVRRTFTWRVLRLRLMSETRQPGPVLREGVHFEVDTAGRIDWTRGDALGLAPRPAQDARRPGGRYAVTYLHNPSYLVQNWPYPMRILHTKRKVPVPLHTPGPVSAMAMMEARQDKPGAQTPDG